MAAFHVFLVDEEDEEAEDDEKIKEEIIDEESAEDPLLITAEEGKENTYRALIERSSSWQLYLTERHTK